MGNGVRERVCSICGFVQSEEFAYGDETTATYYISYLNLQGLTHANPTQYTGNDLPIVLIAPYSRLGYSFDGWYDSPEAGNKIDSIPLASAEDVVLYAHWSKSRYTITYLGITGEPTNPTSYSVDESVILVNPASRVGYSFTEWRDEEDAPTTGIDLGEEGDRTFRAVWQIINYEITYLGTQGAINANPVTYNVLTDTINLSAPELAGHAFLGWYDAETGGALVGSIPKGTTGDIILYARFEAASYTIFVNGEEKNAYVVSFNGNGTAVLIEDQEVTALQGLVYPDIPERDGYLFAGWFVDEECIGTPYDFTSEVRKDMTLYAKWIQAEGAVITVGGNLPVLISGQTIRCYDFVPLVSGKITVYTSGSVDTYGALYSGSSLLSSNDDGADTNFSFTYNVTAGTKYQIRVRGFSVNTSGSSTLYVTGTALPADGGFTSDVKSTVIVQYGDSYDLGVAAARPSYNFVGYFTDIDCKGTQLTDAEGKSLAVWTFEEDLAVFPGYEPTKYTVTFDSQGGSAVAPITLDYGDALNLTARPTLDGKSFSGWYLSTEDAEPYSATTMPAENIVLYAKWITYALNDLKYDADKTAISVNDEVNAALFSAVLVDTDGEEVEVTASIIDGEQAAGGTVSIRLLASGKYNKRKQVTIDSVRVYTNPTLSWNGTRDYINLSDPLDGVPFGASGTDSFGESTVITAEIEGEYAGGDTVTVILHSTDPAGNVTSESVENVKVYDSPVITYERKTAAKVGDVIDLAFFSATAADDFGIPCEVVFSSAGEQVAGGAVNVTLTSEDSKGNVREIVFDVAIYGAPSILSVAKQDYKVQETVTVESLDIVAKDSHGGDAAEISISVTSGEKAAGRKEYITITAVDLVGNEAESVIFVRYYDDPLFYCAKTAIKDTDDTSDVSVYGIQARDSFGNLIHVEAEVTGGEQVVGESLTVLFTATDAAGNTVTMERDFDVLSVEDIVISYNPGQSDLVKLTSKGEEFGATATDSLGNPCTISVIGDSAPLSAGSMMNIILRATDAAGNSKDTAVISDIKVYGTPKVTYKKHTEWYLTAEDSRVNFFRVTDSFGVELYSEETILSETDTECVVSVLSDPDEAGNVFERTLTLVKLAVGTSLVDLYANGERIGGAVLTRGEAYSLPCPEGYHYVWSIDSTPITDYLGHSLAVWDEEDGGYTATAEIEIISYSVTYNLDGGTNDAGNISSYTIESVGSGFTLLDPAKVTNEETETTALGNGLYRLTKSVTAYTFLGWYTEDTFENEVTEIAFGMGDVTLFAKWSATTSTTTTTEQSYLREGNYIYFGEYPQTEVKDSEITSALNAAAGSLPTESDSSDWTSYGYYISGSVSNFMWYIDLEYSGEKYRGVYFTQYRPYYTGNSSSASNSYQDDNDYSTSTVYWFKYEPIKWRILSEANGEALILCEMIIDSQEYYSSNSSYSFSHNGGTGYANNYALSNIRKWLNDTFYNTAFTDLQKQLIVLTTVDNSARSTNPNNNATEWNSGTNTCACANTEDYVFLLSLQEVTNSAYGFSSCGDFDTARRKQNTDYAKSQGAWTSTSSAYKGNGCWWLRSPPYDTSTHARYVDEWGYGGRECYVRITGKGVVPALKIKLD